MDKVGEIIGRVGDKLTPEQASQVLTRITGFGARLMDNALLCQVGGAITEVAVA